MLLHWETPATLQGSNPATGSRGQSNFDWKIIEDAMTVLDHRESFEVYYNPTGEADEIFDTANSSVYTLVFYDEDFNFLNN